jgi:hypothetical protein
MILLASTVACWSCCQRMHGVGSRKTGFLFVEKVTICLLIFGVFLSPRLGQGVIYCRRGHGGCRIETGS